MKTWTRLLFGATALTSVAFGAPAFAAGLDDTVTFQIAPGSLDEALIAYGQQADLQVISASTAVRGKHTAGVEGASTPREALAMLLRDSGLHFVATGDNTVTVTADPQSGSAAGDGAEGTIAALIVTAQKKEEAIQDVPIAISAFTEKSLEEQKIEGGFDLLKAIPNVTFSKNNFSTYNFSIRGIGTKAVSVTTDPGVAVEFNSVAFIRNRLFEQEYFDVERVEVLRGPQGTLHGRNATAGVINVISAKANMDEFAGWLKGEVGNYHSKRVSAMVNVPLVKDKLAIRFAGALTDRSGYDYNTVTQHPINGRDLWSGRITVGFQPTDRLHADLIWERFNEDDDRSRTGKQLCHRAPGAVTEYFDGSGMVQLSEAQQGQTSQGCKLGSLYDDGAFETPNGYSIPFIAVATAASSGGTAYGALIINPVDPYGGLMQSRDLRTVASVRDPKYQAKTDVLELNVSFDLTENLVLTSSTGYNKDWVYSTQDFNRFNSFPVFKNTSDPATTPRDANGSPLGEGDGTWSCYLRTPGAPFGTGECIDYSGLAPGGIFNDPQIGPSNTIAGIDISQSKSTQFSQEFRVESSFPGKLNFGVGANYLRYRVLEDYYVFFNLITALSASVLNTTGDIQHCAYPLSLFAPLYWNTSPQDPIDSPGCVYIDPNPLQSINGEGHNYFRSKNPYRLQSASAFGELYWQARDNLKVTMGLRYNDDRKTFTPVPSQLLLSSNPVAGGTVDRGYPADPDIKQHWGEVTGRLGVDWKPDLSWTDQTMIYAFYSRGYKGGGANPPGVGFSKVPYQVCEVGPELCAMFNLPPDFTIPPTLQTLPYPLIFKPEFVNAYEVGAKNTLLGGGLVLNGDVFFYDYKDYQVSQIKDRTAVNENFDAKIWGLEMEAMFQPTRNLRFNGTFGYQDSKIADGEKSIDLMDRTQGNPDWVVVKAWIQLPSNCIIKREWLEQISPSYYAGICPGSSTNNPALTPEQYAMLPNSGAGFDADLGGNQLPNAPHWTTSLGAQYGFDFLDGWRATVRADAYWQSQSWARVYNDNPYDKLHGWYNANLSVWFEKPDDDLKIELYAKNLLDKTPITDAFLNSDDTGLTTNVFVLDPRLIGLSIKKGF